MTRGCPGQWRKAARGGEQRGLGRKASQVEVICEERATKNASLKVKVSKKNYKNVNLNYEVSVKTLLLNCFY